MSASASDAAALPGPDDRYRIGLVESEKLRERHADPPGNPPGNRQRRTRVTSLNLGQHGRRYAGSLREVSQGEGHVLAKGAKPPAERCLGGVACRLRRRDIEIDCSCGWGRHGAYAITVGRLLSRSTGRRSFGLL